MTKPHEITTNFEHSDKIAESLTRALTEVGLDSTSEAADFASTFVLLQAARLIEQLQELPIDPYLSANRDYRRGYGMALSDAAARLRGLR